MRHRNTSRNDDLTAAIERWFGEHARDLPWRTSPRDAYRSLVSEFMLQQTQVSRVLEKWDPFVRRFPTVQALAEAAEDDVLALWSGMGYYRRAKNLHRAAQAVVAEHGGRVPEELDHLVSLPGVGRYTAGAIASIAYGRSTPIVDGNVARVLMRIEGRDFAHGSAHGQAWAWEHATELVQAARDPAAFNEGLMELGAVVCTPAAPKCDECPVAAWCTARAEGKQNQIPRPKAKAAQKVMYCECVIVRDGRGRILVEQRGESGMWAGLWQAPTLEVLGRGLKKGAIRDWAGGQIELIESFVHQTTHREVRFRVWKGAAVPGQTKGSFRSEEQIGRLALSNPMRRILLGESGKGGGGAIS